MTVGAALILGGVVWPLVIVAFAVLVPAAAAGVLATLLRYSILFSLPIAVSALLVNLFFFPGGQTILFQLGPITPLPKVSRSRSRSSPGSRHSPARSRSST